MGGVIGAMVTIVFVEIAEIVRECSTSSVSSRINFKLGMEMRYGIVKKPFVFGVGCLIVAMVTVENIF